MGKGVNALKSPVNGRVSRSEHPDISDALKRSLSRSGYGEIEKEMEILMHQPINPDEFKGMLDHIRENERELLFQIINAYLYGRITGIRQERARRKARAARMQG